DCQNATAKANELRINQTESLRIAGELKRWIGGGKNNQARNARDKSRLRRLRRKDIEFPENAVINYETLYRKPLRQPADFIDDLGEWNALLQALHRRDDTFYVVGVGKGQHLLLPAVSHNITRPPKMALILPARNSSMNDHVTLMQIDCSVVNTTIVQLKSDALPESLRKQTDEVNAPVYDNPKPKPSKITKDNVDPSLPVLHNPGDTNSRHPNNQPTKHEDIGQGDIFASYITSKYEDTKNGAVKNKRKNETTCLNM
ncbi:Cyclic AMP-dependent transcription factor ATF-6 beta, partial [Operophtera brumata]